MTKKKVTKLPKKRHPWRAFETEPKSNGRKDDLHYTRISSWNRMGVKV